MEVRSHIVVRGWSRGWGFAGSSHRKAASLGLNGWVQNAADGAVAIEAQGDRSLVEELLREVRVGPRSAQVTDLRSNGWSPCTQGPVPHPLTNLPDRNMTQRIGFGYDVHRLTAGRKLILGGVEIPSEKGCDGHSDADVLLHAIADALLGAAALGDIGRHFPNTDPRYKGISSLILLRHVAGLLGQHRCSVVNVDTTVHPRSAEDRAARRTDAPDHRASAGHHAGADLREGHDQRRDGVRRRGRRGRGCMR